MRSKEDRGDHPRLGWDAFSPGIGPARPSEGCRPVRRLPIGADRPGLAPKLRGSARWATYNARAERTGIDRGRDQVRQVEGPGGDPRRAGPGVIATVGLLRVAGDVRPLRAEEMGASIVPLQARTRGPDPGRDMGRPRPREAGRHDRQVHRPRQERGEEEAQNWKPLRPGEQVRRTRFCLRQFRVIGSTRMIRQPDCSGRVKIRYFYVIRGGRMVRWGRSPGRPSSPADRSEGVRPSAHPTRSVPVRRTDPSPRPRSPRPSMNRSA